MENNKAPIFDKNSYSFRIGQTPSIGSVRASVSENTIKVKYRLANLQRHNITILLQ